MPLDTAAVLDALGNGERAMIACPGSAVAGKDVFLVFSFFAEAGKGTTLNGRRIHVSSPRRVADSLLVTGFAYDRATRADFYLRGFKAFMTRSHDVCNQL